MHLPVEIWILIFQFLTILDICKFRYLSRRGNSLYFLIGRNFNLNFLIDNSKKIFCIEEYYDTLKNQFVSQLSKHLKVKFPFPTYLFMRYCLENFLRMATVSNTLLHLFYCPRSFFAKSNCLLCKRLFLRKDLIVSIEFDSLLKANTVISEKDYDFKYFWDNEHQRNVICSDMKRCLNVLVIQDSIDLLLQFIEIQGRYFNNFFHTLAGLCSIKKSEKIYLINLSANLFDNFLCYVLRHVRLNYLNDLFEDISKNQFKYLRVINQKYKDKLKKKYES